MFVSAILLTHPRTGEAQFLRDARFCFAQQSYRNLELIEVRDGEKAEVVYTTLGLRITVAPGLTVGAKRNIACDHARGEIIAHWDSDDLSAPDRLAVQVQQLRGSGCEMVGFHTMHFLNDETKTAHFYRSYPGYALGTSLVYHRAAWSRNRFQDLQVGEDNVFLQAFRHEKKYTTDAERLLIARNHAHNTSYREYRSSDWTVEDYDIIATWADAICPGRFDPHEVRERDADRSSDRDRPRGRSDRTASRRRTVRTPADIANISS